MIIVMSQDQELAVCHGQMPAFHWRCSPYALLALGSMLWYSEFQ
jgi:hypothetical protein